LSALPGADDFDNKALVATTNQTHRLLTPIAKRLNLLNVKRCACLIDQRLVYGHPEPNSRGEPEQAGRLRNGPVNDQ